MYYTFFIHSSVDRYLKCFHILTIVNTDRVSRGELITLGDPYFSLLGYISSILNHHFNDILKCQFTRKVFPNVVKLADSVVYNKPNLSPGYKVKYHVSWTIRNRKT